MKYQIKKAVIPVAGLGTRGLPFTKEVPKELLPIIDTPTIHFIVQEVIEAGIEQVIFITSKGKSLLEDYFDPSPSLEHWLRQRGKHELADAITKIGTLCEVISIRQKVPLGLGHAIYCARHIIRDEMFAVCLGDEIFPAWEGHEKSPLGRLVKTAEELKTSVVGVVEIPKDECGSYGMVDLGGNELKTSPIRVTRAVEKPKPTESPSPYAVIGRYVFGPSLFEAMSGVQPGVGGEIQLTDGMNALAKQNELFALRIDGPRYDIGSHFFFVKAQIDAALRRPLLSEKLKSYLKSLDLQK